MSTEQKPATEQQPATAAATAPTVTPPSNEPKAEPTALAKALTGGWDKFKQGKLLSYPMMALLLVAIVGFAVTWYILREKRKGESAKWTELESLSTISAYEEFIKKNPNSTQGKLAQLEIARTQLTMNGVELFAAPSAEVRKTAVENVEKARDTFAKLADEFKNDALLKSMCLLGAAKAESSLVGMLKDGSLDQFRGDPKKAIEWLDKVSEAAPETDWGKDSKKLADTLRNQNTQEQVRLLQSSVYSIPAPSLPDLKMPKDPIHGGGSGLPILP
jgi:hypothetical protein